MIIGILCGLIVNIFEIELLNGLATAVDMIASISLTIALFGMGGVLYRYHPAGDIGIIFIVGLISLLVHPAMVWSLGKFFSLDTPAFRSAVLTSAMAPGINAYIFASMYGTGRRIAASSVLLTTVASIFTIWCWLSLLP